MDAILPIILVLSLTGNFFQHEKIEDLKEERSELAESSEANYKAYLIAKKANEEYDSEISNLVNDIEKCNKTIKEQINKANSWIDSDRIKGIAIENLEARLDSVDFGTSCRVPDGVDFKSK